MKPTQQPEFDPPTPAPWEWLGPDLAAAVSKMPPRRQRVLWLRFALQWTQQEVAESLGCNQQAVSRHEQTAREALRSAGRRLVYHPQPRRSLVPPAKRLLETDSTAEEYAAEIARIDRLIRKYRGVRRRATRPRTVARLNKTLHTLWTGRGQLRRIVAYLRSHERLITDLPSADGVQSLL